MKRGFFFISILLSFLISPNAYSLGHQQSSFLKLNRKKTTNFQQALAQLYVQKPNLLHPQLPVDSLEALNSFSLKAALNKICTALPLLYFFYCSYVNYTNHTMAQKRFQDSFIHQTVLCCFPSLLVNTPRHISFFLQETELLLQAYLLKIFLKMIILCLG